MPHAATKVTRATLASTATLFSGTSRVDLFVVSNTTGGTDAVVFTDSDDTTLFEIACRDGWTFTLNGPIVFDNGLKASADSTPDGDLVVSIVHSNDLAVS